MVELLQNKIEVTSSSIESKQARIFFGRETSLGIKVVVKQYKNDLRGLFREIKIFTELERNKSNRASEHPKRSDEESSKLPDTNLPQMLGYAIDKKNSVGEILMIDSGSSLDEW